MWSSPQTKIVYSHKTVSILLHFRKSQVNRKVTNEGVAGKGPLYNK